MRNVLVPHAVNVRSGVGAEYAWMTMVRRALMVIRAQLVINALEEYACQALVSLFMVSARCVIQRSTHMHD